jgi:hypothetical protein
MKRVPADEFAERAAEYLAGTEPLSIEKDGEILGYYTPVPNGHTANGTASIPRKRKNTPEAIESYERLKETIRRIRERNGMTEDEFADLFDLTKPFPYDLDPKS